MYIKCWVDSSKIQVFFKRFVSLFHIDRKFIKYAMSNVEKKLLVTQADNYLKFLENLKNHENNHLPRYQILFVLPSSLLLNL